VQDLVVHILAPQRYEVANYDNIAVPTNLDVPDSARDAFAATYANIFDGALAAHPRAVVTEYAWSPGSCDPCPGPSLTGADFATLGGDVAPSFHGVTSAAGSPSLRQGAVAVTGPLPSEVVQRIVRQNFGRFRLCYENGLKKNPNLAGRATLTFTITPQGTVGSVSSQGSDLADAEVLQCAARGASNLSFPDAPAPSKVVFPVAFSVGASGGPLSPQAAGWVLTRLHARYGKDALGEDLVFRPAPAITGGREVYGVDGKTLEQGATAAGTNNFQARYAIRHPWTGAVACASPRRGVWGGKPGGGEPPALAAQKVAFARGGTAGGAVAMPATSAAATTLGDAEAPADATPGPPPPSPRSRGCAGCSLGGDGRDAWGTAAVVGVAALASTRRRRRSRSARSTHRPFG
jgi:MYXO-CTERM domain-containing protein